MAPATVTRHLDGGIRIIDRDNYVLANNDTYSSQYIIVSSDYALNTLECFGNLLLSINKLLVDENCISKELEREVCNFGFIASSVDDWTYVQDRSDGARFYLINYVAFLKNVRKKHDTSSLFNRKMTAEILNEMKSAQGFNFALRCAVGCIIDRFADRMSRAWMDWHNVVWGVVDKYFFELQKYEVLLHYHRTRLRRQQVFERYCKLPMRWEVSRDHVIKEDAVAQAKNEVWTDKMVEKLEEGEIGQDVN